jgi:cell division septum initiation protein DivIVA
MATKAYNARVNSLNDMVSTATANVSGLTAVGNDLSAALKALRGDSDDAVKMLRAQAQATLQSALATARSGGSLSGITGLSDALDTVSSNNTDLYSSMEDFARDQGRTANVVAELNALNGKQLTTEEQLLASLQDQVKLAKDQFDEEMAKFDQQLDLAQAQIDALNGVDNSVLSVAAAMSGLPRSLARGGRPGLRRPTLRRTTRCCSTRCISRCWGVKLTRPALRTGVVCKSGGIDYAGWSQQSPKTPRPTGAQRLCHWRLITGPGTGTSDSIFARLSNGEYVMSADAVRMFGTGCSIR